MTQVIVTHRSKCRGFGPLMDYYYEEGEKAKDLVVRRLHQ